MSKPKDILSYAHGKLGWPIKQFNKVIMTGEVQGDDEDGQHHLLPAGTKGEVDSIEWFDATDHLAVTIAIPIGGPTAGYIFNTFEESDHCGEDFPFKPDLEAAEPVRRTYQVLVRGVKHLTKGIEVEATSSAEAEILAYDTACKPEFQWDESDPWDVNIEGCWINEA